MVCQLASLVAPLMHFSARGTLLSGQHAPPDGALDLEGLPTFIELHCKLQVLYANLTREKLLRGQHTPPDGALDQKGLPVDLAAHRHTGRCGLVMHDVGIGQAPPEPALHQAAAMSTIELCCVAAVTKYCICSGSARETG